MTRKRQRLRPTLLAIAWALILIGLWILLSPIIHQELQIIRAGEDVQEFLAVRNQTATEKSSPRSGPRHTSSASDETAANSSETEAAEAQPESVDGSGLLAAMRRYNETIYQSSQPGRFAAEPFTAQVLDLQSFGLETEVVGVLEIPRMELIEPVFLGATDAHLNRGAAQLSFSSMPIGGINTNCVIAGHRGWKGALHFRHIELLKEGDKIYLTNLWDRLVYRVEEIMIINPWDLNHLLIQPGHDRLTLVTCHPYGSGGKFRYIVICERTM